MMLRMAIPLLALVLCAGASIALAAGPTDTHVDVCMKAANCCRAIDEYPNITIDNVCDSLESMARQTTTNAVEDERFARWCREHTERYVHMAGQARQPVPAICR